MKKFIVLLSIVAMLFAFTACDDDPNNDTPASGISDTDMTIAKNAYAAAVDDINSKLPTGTDDPEESAGGEHSVTFKEGTKTYKVDYTFTYTAGDTAEEAVWNLRIEVTSDDYSMSFDVGSDSSERVGVTVNTDKYDVGAIDIKNGKYINGVDTDNPEFDNPEQTDPEEPEQTDPDESEPQLPVEDPSGDEQQGVDENGELVDPVD